MCLTPFYICVAHDRIIQIGVCVGITPQQMFSVCKASKHERRSKMKLIGELKDKVEKAETKGEAKEIIKDAGMELTDEEMDKVAGGPRVFNELIKNQ
jgi:hypothetical protein